jgi:hypothetical protein
MRRPETVQLTHLLWREKLRFIDQHAREVAIAHEARVEFAL